MTAGRWYRASKGTPFATIPHNLGSRDWLSEERKTEPPALGEWAGPRLYDTGAPPAALPRNITVGSPDCISNGETSPPAAPGGIDVENHSVFVNLAGDVVEVECTLYTSFQVAFQDGRVFVFNDVPLRMTRCEGEGRWEGPVDVNGHPAIAVIRLTAPAPGVRAWNFYLCDPTTVAPPVPVACCDGAAIAARVRCVWRSFDWVDGSGEVVHPEFELIHTDDPVPAFMEDGIVTYDSGHWVGTCVDGDRTVKFYLACTTYPAEFVWALWGEIIDPVSPDQTYACFNSWMTQTCDPFELQSNYLMLSTDVGEFPYSDHGLFASKLWNKVRVFV